MGWLAGLAVVVLVFAAIPVSVLAVPWLSFFDQEAISFPPPGYTLRWYVNAWDKRQFARGFVLSQVAVLAACIGVALGTAAAVALVRGGLGCGAPGAWGGLLLAPLAIRGVVLGTLVGSAALGRTRTPRHTGAAIV